MDAPKNIWTDWRAANDASVAFDHPPENDGEGYRTKYILAAEHERIMAEKDAEIARLRHQIHEASEPDFLFGAMDNVHDMDVTLADFADAASRAIRAALENRYE